MSKTSATPAIEQLPLLASDKLHVDHTRCLRVRNRNTSCEKCAAACNSGCITLCGNGIAVDPKRCVGCGTCSAVCPASAIEAIEPDDAALLREGLNVSKRCGGSAVFACEHARRVEGAVSLVCLSRVDESLMLSLLSGGANRVVLVCGDCEGCPQANCIQTTRSMAASANALLGAWGRAEAVTIADEVPEGCRAKASAPGSEPSLPVSSQHPKPAEAGDEPVKEARVYPKVDKRRRTLPQYLPPRHEKVLEALGQLGEPIMPTVESRLWAEISIDAEKCVSCQMCATFCTTGAIKRLPSKDGFGIVHTPVLCVACGCCRDICPAGAVNLSSVVSCDDLVCGTKHCFDMEPVTHPSGTPHGIAWRMRELLNSNLVADF